MLAWKSIYMMGPAFFANMAPVFFRKVPFLNYPIDFSMRWKSKPLFGSHKTFRGFFFGILLAIILVYIQELLFYNYSYFRSISFIDYPSHNFLLLGFLIGFGALLGDTIKSFLKRRFNVRPGARWFPWDQVDFIIGSLLFLCIIFVPPWQAALFLLIATPLLHIIVKHIGYYLKIDNARW